VCLPPGRWVEKPCQFSALLFRPLTGRFNRGIAPWVPLDGTPGTKVCHWEGR